MEQIRSRMERSSPIATLSSIETHSVLDRMRICFDFLLEFRSRLAASVCRWSRKALGKLDLQGRSSNSFDLLSQKPQAELLLVNATLHLCRG